MLAAQIDDASYLFARPTFVGATTGTRVKNIRIAVNDTVPVAAQAFRRIDTVAMASGAELSRLGSVIPVAQGPDTDRFHLEFEAARHEIRPGGVGRAVSIRRRRRADVPEPALGLRSFSRVNDTMSALTGVPLLNASVETLYTEIRDTLPASGDLLAFGSAQQVAIQRLAVGYCGQIVAVATHCNTFFATTNCAITAGTRGAIADKVYDNAVRHESRQPTRSSGRRRGARRRHERLGMHGRLHGGHGGDGAAGHVCGSAVERRRDDQLIRNEVNDMSKLESRRAASERRRRLEQRIEDECRRSGHARPTNRREFLGRGLIAGVSTVFLPSIATILAREAQAQAAACVIDASPTLGAGKIPFLAFDQGGGANIAGSNVMVGKVGGQEVFLDPAGYAKLGLPAAILPQTLGVDRTFGLAMHPRSALLRGMLRKTSAATRANTNGFVIPARSENDTQNNPHNPTYGIARAGANGEFVATIGTQNIRVRR